jgi:hypothetical protein
MESKRKLTEEEIERLLGIVELPRGVPRATAQSIQHLNRERLRAQLTDVEIYPTMVDELGKSLLQFYQKTQIQPGESVGVMTAQSIGERQTQTTLNTFHSCGQAIKTVVTGVPRFSELLNATTNPKAVNCNIFFNQATGSIDDLRRVIGSDFVDIRLSNLVQSKTVFTEPKRERWYDVWCQFHGRDFERFTHGLSYKLDLGKMFEHSITLSMVADKIEEAYGDASCVWSPDAFGVLDVWVDVADVDNDEGLFDTMEEARSTFLEEIVDEALEQLHICGIEGVKNIFYEKKQGEWMVETDGSNLRKIFAHPAVDMTRTVCNNVWEIYQTLGIEAARNLAGIKDANSAEFDPENGTHVIATMAGQEDVIAGDADMGGTMRLGLYTAELVACSIVAQTYGSPTIAERHRHRYEVNNTYRDSISDAGLLFSGINKELNLVEFVELPKEVHPYYVGTQAHPELRSRPTRPHPLFIGLIQAAIQAKG